MRLHRLHALFMSEGRQRRTAGRQLRRIESRCWGGDVALCAARACREVKGGAPTAASIGCRQGSAAADPGAAHAFGHMKAALTHAVIESRCWGETSFDAASAAAAAACAARAHEEVKGAALAAALRRCCGCSRYSLEGGKGCIGICGDREPLLGRDLF